MMFHTKLMFLINEHILKNKSNEHVVEIIFDKEVMHDIYTKIGIDPSVIEFFDNILSGKQYDSHINHDNVSIYVNAVFSSRLIFERAIEQIKQQVKASGTKQSVCLNVYDPFNAHKRFTGYS